MTNTADAESLQANQLGSVQLSFTNVSPAVFADGRLEVRLENGLSGFFTQNEATYFFKALLPNETKKIDIPIRGEHDLADGQVKLRVVVRSGNREEMVIFPTVRCLPKPISPQTYSSPTDLASSTKVTITITKPATTKAEIQLDGDNLYETEYLLLSKNRLDTAAIVFLKNDLVQKNSAEISESFDSASMQFKYFASCKFQDFRVGVNELSVKYNGTRSEKLRVRFELRRPNLHVLAIGPAYPSNSQISETKLAFNVKDAREVATAFSKMGNNEYYQKVFIDTLISYNTTTKTEIESAFESLLKRYKREDDSNHIRKIDFLLIFFSGHGAERNDDGQFCLLPSDFKLSNPQSTFVSLKDIFQKNLNKIECKKVLFLDACKSGGAKGVKSTHADEVALANALDLAYKTAAETTIISSCEKGGYSYEIEPRKNGAFTAALLEAMSGEPVRLKNGVPLSIEPNSPDKMVSIAELFAFLEKRVPDLVQRYRAPTETQTPTMPEHKLNRELKLFRVK